jgi:hypothetical protein
LQQLLFKLLGCRHIIVHIIDNGRLRLPNGLDRNALQQLYFRLLWVVVLQSMLVLQLSGHTVMQLWSLGRLQLLDGMDRRSV